MADADEAIAWLVERVPELRPLLEEHLAACGERLPYVLFEDDYMRWLTERVRSGDHEPAIEPLIASNRVRNIADICFVEQLMMNGDDDVIDVARPWMGPVTWENVQRMYWHRSGKLPPTG